MTIRRLRMRFYRKTGGPRHIGLRCKAYGPGCIVCECYRYLDEHGRFPSSDEAVAVCDQLLAEQFREMQLGKSP